MTENEMNKIRLTFSNDLSTSSRVVGRMIGEKTLLSIALKRAETASLEELRAMCPLLEEVAQKRFKSLLELLGKHIPATTKRVEEKEVYHYL